MYCINSRNHHIDRHCSCRISIYLYHLVKRTSYLVVINFPLFDFLDVSVNMLQIRSERNNLIHKTFYFRDVL